MTIALLDSFAEKQWRTKSSARLEEELKNYPEGELPDKYRGPFSWKRLGEKMSKEAS